MDEKQLIENFETKLDAQLKTVESFKESTDKSLSETSSKMSTLIESTSDLAKDFTSTKESFEESFEDVVEVLEQLKSRIAFLEKDSPEKKHDEEEEVSEEDLVKKLESMGYNVTKKKEKKDTKESHSSMSFVEGEVAEKKMSLNEFVKSNKFKEAVRNL